MGTLKPGGYMKNPGWETPGNWIESHDGLLYSLPPLLPSRSRACTQKKSKRRKRNICSRFQTKLSTAFNRYCWKILANETNAQIQQIVENLLNDIVHIPKIVPHQVPPKTPNFGLCTQIIRVHFCIARIARKSACKANPWAHKNNPAQFAHKTRFSIQKQKSAGFSPNFGTFPDQKK